MRVRPLAGGMVLCASLPLMGIAASPSTLSHADVSISVSAAESCVWYLENLPSVINMQSETKYRGEPLLVSATISPALGFSGNPAVPGYNTACSFFYSSFTTKKLQLAIDSSQFVATYGGIGDDSLSFGLDERPLSVQVSNVDQACQRVIGMPLTVPGNFGWGKNKSSISTPFEVAAYSDVPDYGVKNFFSSGNSAKCAPELEFEVEISSAQSGPPAGAGQTYVFTGPSITFNMEPVATDFDSVAQQSLNASRTLAPNSNADLKSRTLSPYQETFRFSVDFSESVVNGSLYGTAAEFRFVPMGNPTWYFTRQNWTNNPRTNVGRVIERTFGRDGKPFTTWVSVNYQIDYRYPGTDWVEDIARKSRESEKTVYRVRGS